jgi:hypothetical protein
MPAGSEPVPPVEPSPPASVDSCECLVCKEPGPLEMTETIALGADGFRVLSTCGNLLPINLDRMTLTRKTKGSMA